MECIAGEVARETLYEVVYRILCFLVRDSAYAFRLGLRPDCGVPDGRGLCDWIRTGLWLELSESLLPERWTSPEGGGDVVRDTASCRVSSLLTVYACRIVGSRYGCGLVEGHGSCESRDVVEVAGTAVSQALSELCRYLSWLSKRTGYDPSSAEEETGVPAGDSLSVLTGRQDVRLSIFSSVLSSILVSDFLRGGV